MLRVGHYGVALVAYAPVGATLLVAGFDGIAVVAGAATVALTMLPDVDEVVPLVEHRGATHTLGFAAVVALAVGVGAGEVLPTAFGVPAAAARVVGAAVGALAVGAHLLADALTPAGVAVLWPFADRRLSLGVCSAGSRVANWSLFAVGVTAVAVAVVAVEVRPLP